MFHVKHYCCYSFMIGVTFLLAYKDLSSEKNEQYIDICRRYSRDS